MKFENIEVSNMENAIRGVRNPLNSWLSSDSKFGIDSIENVKAICKEIGFDYSEQNYILKRKGDLVEYAIIGPRDILLCKNLIKGGSEQRKFLRQIFISVDITAPLYW